MGDVHVGHVADASVDIHVVAAADHEHGVVIQADALVQRNTGIAGFNDLAGSIKVLASGIIAVQLAQLIGAVVLLVIGEPGVLGLVGALPLKVIGVRNLDDSGGAVHEVGLSLKALVNAADLSDIGDEHVVVGSLHAVSVDDIAVSIQDQIVVILQVVGAAVALAVLVLGAVKRDVLIGGVGGHSAGDDFGSLNGLDLVAHSGDQDIIAVLKCGQVFKVVGGQGGIDSGEGIQAQIIQLQLLVLLVVAAVHLSHIGVNLRQDDVVVVVHKHLGQDALGSALGVVGFVVHKVVGHVRAADRIAIHVNRKISGLRSGDIVVDGAANHVIQIALVHSGSKGSVSLSRISADDVVLQLPLAGGAGKVVLTVDLFQICEVTLTELLGIVVAVAGIVAVGLGDRFSGSVAHDDGGAVRLLDSGAAAGVAHHVGLQGLVGHLGSLLTGHGIGHDYTGHGDTGIHGIGGHIDGPVVAHILLDSGIIAQGHQQHLGKRQSGQLTLGIEGAVACARQNILLGAVADVAGRPAVGSHIAEHSGVSGQVLGIVAQEHAADDGRSLLTGQNAGRIKGALVGALEHAERGHDFRGLGVSDLVAVDEITARSGGADDHHTDEHDSGQNQAESPLEVSHLDFLLLNFEA